MEITCYRNSELHASSPFTSRHLQPCDHFACSEQQRLPDSSPSVPCNIWRFWMRKNLCSWTGTSKCQIDIAWRKFRPMERSTLTTRLVMKRFITCPRATLMSRLLAEFPLALRSLTGKERIEGPARVLKFPTPESSLVVVSQFRIPSCARARFASW